MIFSFDLLSAEVIQRQVNLNTAQKNEVSQFLVSQFPVDLVTFTEEILNRKFHFLYNAI